MWHVLARFGPGAAAAVVLLQGMVLAPAAAAATAKELFDDGNRLFRDDLYFAALLRYRQAAEAGMDSALLHYNTGVAHYRAGQYDRARQAFARAADEPRLAWRAQYNLGLTELAAGNQGAAADLFRRVRDQHAEPQLAALARRALAQLQTPAAAAQPDAPGVQRTGEARPFGALELHATVGVGSDDNAFRSPHQPYADRAQAGSPTVVPVVQSGVFYPLDLVARYAVNSFEHESFFGSYHLAGRYYQDAALGNANEFAHEAAVGSEYRRREDDRERWIFSAFTIAQHDETWYDRDSGIERDFNGATVGERLSYVRYGPELRLRQAYGRLAFSGRVSGQLWNYEAAGDLPEYDHEYLGATLGVQYRFTGTSLLRVSAAA
ncbi:MAG TPA: tetratricopeptide repeat protein, partial [Woeseiaceae bacterium]|nr:tetratricopeptide repeat protein [Woeseiaceae bacterium]